MDGFARLGMPLGRVTFSQTSWFWVAISSVIRVSDTVDGSVEVLAPGWYIGPQEAER